jgi:uncharacterized protein (TIGR03435 family)
MRRVIVAIVGVGILVPAAVRVRGQVERARFEVASIKPNTSGEIRSRTSGRDNGFTATNTSPWFLIITAFNIKEFQLTGGPSWTRSERFDVNGRVAEGQKYTRAALQTLLEERFKLVTHRDTREESIYALVVVRSNGRLGPQIKPTATLDCAARRGANPSGPAVSPCSFNSTLGDAGGKMSVVGQPMEALAAMLGNIGLGRQVQVVDRTGLTGKYDFELQWSSDNVRPASDAPADPPGVFTALQEQLGLKLESQRGPVEFVVIDSIDRPTPD